MSSNNGDSSKPVILTFVGHYLPGYKCGGPIRSIANIVDRLSNCFDFRIVTADRDIGDMEPFSKIKVNEWNPVGGARVFYLSPSNRTIPRFAKLMRNTSYDALYLNSFFSPVFTLYPLLIRRLGLSLKRPTLIAPRGEFSKGALALKFTKKRIFIATARVLGFHRGVFWHASSRYEALEIREALGTVASRVLIAPNLAGTHQDIKERNDLATRTPREPLRLCFLSRISPKKNLEFAFMVLARVKEPVTFDIYGVIEDAEYWKRCQKLADTIGISRFVRYCGNISHEEVSNTLRRYDLFFLPTRGENFGHAILEAMIEGTPVLIADTTPWRGLEQTGVGWDLPLNDPEAFVAAITKATTLSTSEYKEWRERVRAHGIQNATSIDAVKANQELFRTVLETGTANPP
jgi:glycosyltransferase involved in cell wall biosynthesis